MKRYLFMLLALFTVVSASALNADEASIVQDKTNNTHISSSCVLSSDTNTFHGVLNGANYTIAVPADWNGTLLLYSHGYTFANQPLDNPAPDASDSLSGATLLQQGYALAGSSYSQNGWAIQQALHDQMALLDYFDATCGRPVRTIAWGDSLGGMITAALVQLYPERFSAALPMCGVLAGGIGTWNAALDSAFAFNVLLAGNKLPIVHITNPPDTLKQATALLASAQQSVQGKARIALIAALSDVPGWFQIGSPQPASNDFAAQEQNQYLWESQVDFAFAFAARAELEARAGGNVSWNTNVDYFRQLLLSADHPEVENLYRQAGLNLFQDLARLDATSRVAADPRAVAYLNRYITFNGDVDVPTLTMHTMGDGLVPNEEEQAYASAARQWWGTDLLRQVFVNRAGHCAFTSAEKITAMQTLVKRLNTKRWGALTDPALMNGEAAALGATLNRFQPAFLNFYPAPFLRPFNGHP